MEIFIEEATTENIKKWLNKSYQIVDSKQDTGDSEIIYINVGKFTIPVVITEGIENTKFTGVWFNSENLPWSNLEELVKYTAKEYSMRIRYEKIDLSPVFYEFFDGHVSEITWNNKT